MKKLFSALALAAATAFSLPASAIIVGGINFGTLGEKVHLEAATLAETVVTGVGQEVKGYGEITTVNGLGNPAYCGSGSCALYYYFHGYTVTSITATKVQFNGGVVDIYYSGSGPLNLLNSSSPTNIGLITALTPWVQLTGHSFFDPAFAGVNPTQTLNGNGTLTGATLSENGAGLLDSNIAVGAFGNAGVAAYLDGNSIPDNLSGAGGVNGFADIALTTSANNFVLNPVDVSSGFAASCGSSNPVAGDWCLQGTLNTRGATVPEPEGLALVGIALFGAGVASRRRRRA